MSKQSEVDAHAQVVSRNLPLPRYVWDALDTDARRCGRSSLRQIQALLSAYYGLSDMDLSREGLERMRLASIPLGSSHPTKEATPADPHAIHKATLYESRKKKGGKK